MGVGQVWDGKDKFMVGSGEQVCAGCRASLKLDEGVWLGLFTLT